MKQRILSIIVFSFTLLCILGVSSVQQPAPWPEQFHALLYKNLSSNELQITNTYYDWRNGWYVGFIQKQLGELLYAVLWNNGTSFYYTLGEQGYCHVVEYEVGIPRPDFLDGANYLGTQITDGFLCNVWEKVDFIWYYEDVITRRPVRWDFSNGMSIHVFTVDVGEVLQESMIRAPAHCFNQDAKHSSANSSIFDGFDFE